MSPISFLFGTVCLVHASAIAIIGYVPDYRFNGIDWDKVVSQTTHLVLFSAEPRVDGLRNRDVIRSVLRPNSALSAALQKAGSGAPKLLVSVGGAGRSQEFPDVIGNKKTRKRLAKQLLNLMQELPQLAGIDFDLQVQNPDYLSLAKLVMMLRTAVGSRGGQKPIFTMTFHALAGVLNSFATLTLKQQDSEEKRFVDLFDMCHAMTCTMMDQQGRHSSEKMDTDVVQAWLKYGMPLDHLTLGIPFFGVKNGLAPVTFREIISQERSFASSGSERTKDGFFFVNAENAVKKVKFAEEQGIAGLMIWELGQDAAEESISLLRHIWDAAKNKGILHQLLGITPKEDHLFSVLTVLMGGYYFLRVMQLAMKPSPQPLKSFPKAEAPEEKEEKEEVKEEKKDS